MKKLFFLFVCSFTLVLTSCHQDDELPMPKSDEETISKEMVSSKSSGSIYFPTCSSPATENIQSWSNGTFNLNLATASNQDKKYIWRHKVIVGGVPKFFKVQVKNKSTANYPITVRLVGQDVLTFGTDRWFVINDNGTCKDLLTNNSYRLFDNPSTTSDEGYEADYVQFEVLVPNRNAVGKTNSSVPIEIKICAYDMSPCW